MSDTNSPQAEATGFLTHLIELRDRMLRVVIVLGIAFVVLFPFSKTIYNWLAAPLVDQGQQMIIVGPVAPFLVPMKLTLLVAFLITLPFLLHQMWSFVAPGLYKHEKRLVYPLLASSVFLFYLGILFVYYLLLPMMFKVIPQFAPDVAVFQPDIAQYLDFTMMMFLAFGFGFEMPIATILLITTGMTTAEKLTQKRPYVIVGAFVVGMLLTPPDVISQIMLAIPMWILFELGIIASKFFKVRIKEAQDAKEDRDNADATGETAATLQADKLWEDDKYTYEETDGNNKSISNEYTENDSFETASVEKKSDDENGDDTYEEENYFDNEDYHELSDEEMDAELDRIEAEEEAEEAKEKKAKKKAAKKQKKKDKKAKKKKPKKS